MAPYDVGLHTEIGRTSKEGSVVFPEESPAPTVDKGEEETPTFKILPGQGGNPQGKLEFSALRSFSSLPAPPGGLEALPEWASR